MRSLKIMLLSFFNISLLFSNPDCPPVKETVPYPSTPHLNGSIVPTKIQTYNDNQGDSGERDQKVLKHQILPQKRGKIHFFHWQGVVQGAP